MSDQVACAEAEAFQDRRNSIDRDRHPEGQYEDFLRSAVDWVWETDRNLNYRSVSSGLTRVIGVPSQLLLGTYVFSLTYFRSVNQALLSTIEAIEAREAFRGKLLTVDDAGGRRRMISLSGVPVFDRATGRFRGYRGTGAEVADRDRTEAELRELRTAWRDFTELSSSWRWETDDRLRVTRLSDGYARHAGLSVADSYGQVSSELWRFDSAARALLAARQEFRDQRAEWWHEGRQETRSFALSGKPKLNGEGRFTGFHGIGTDITAHVRTAAGALAAKEAAEGASRAKSDFLAQMSHELRTSLNAIIGFSDAMRSGVLGAKGRKKAVQYAEDIHSSGLHLLDIVDQILDLSRIEAGKAELDEEEVDLAELVDGCCHMLHAEAGRAGVQLAQEADKDLPRLWADRVRLKQILLNLLSNGIKFTPPGGSVHVAARLGRGGEPEIEVRDTGVGIRAEELSKVLTPYGRSGEQRDREGVGLGLAITNSLVQLHGGVLEMTSREGAGTRAVVRLPRERLRT